MMALSVPMERRAIRLGKLLAGELFLHRERVRHAVGLLRVIGDEYFRERPDVDRDLVWAVSEFEETERCEVAGAAVFIAFAQDRAKDDNLERTVTNALLDQLALIYEHGVDALPNANLHLPFARTTHGVPAGSHSRSGADDAATTDQCGSGTNETGEPAATISNAAATDRGTGDSRS